MLKHIGRMSVAGLYVLLGLALSFSVLLSARCLSEASGICDAGSDIRIAGQYVRMKIRQGDVSGAVAADADRILLMEEYNGSMFQDAMYCYGGWLMEQLAAPGVDILDSAGDKVIGCEWLRADLSDGVLRYEMDLGNGAMSRGSVLVRSSGEDAP